MSNNPLDGGVSDQHPFEYDFLGTVAGRIVNKDKGINRIAHDITTKPPGTVEW